MYKKKINVKKVRSNIIDKSNILNKFTQNDFVIFKKKLCGMFIYKGKKSFSIKLFDFFLKGLKRKLNNNPIKNLYKIVINLVPFFLLTQKKIGKRLVYLPMLAKANKKNRFMLNWLVRQLKDKSNIKGIKKEDVLNLMLETLKKKGLAINLKKDFYNLALINKYNLRKSYGDRFIIRKWEKEKYKKDEEKNEYQLLLNFMDDKQIKKWRKKRDFHRLVYFFYKCLLRKKISYKKYIVK